ncbi:MAG TPA: hypothetical protein VGW12_03460 [Pyrinomonadaceae bacterium]|nr:hypothetical protein [Pyrinomonadaceae bacterium]
MERAIEFLLKNQAAYEARQAALDARFEAEREQTNQQIRALAEGQQQIQENINALTGVVNHLSTVMVSMVEVQNRHEGEIDALIKLVGGLIEGRRNGKSEEKSES